jgi:hypothetical protein
MMLVTAKLEIVEGQFEQRLAFDPELWQRQRLALQLRLQAFHVGLVDVRIDKRVCEFARLQPDLLCNGDRQQRVTSQIEWYPDCDVSAPLSQVAIQSAVLHVQNPESVARW